MSIDGVTPNSGLRIARLDSIRFLAALCVALSHGALPLKALAVDPVTKVLTAGIMSSFNGVAAVMIFFIVSGLCIHLPYAGAKTVPVLHFLIRRYLRVGLPLLAICAIAHLMGSRAEGNLQAVTWSVYAELFYYSIYPLVFWLARRFGWMPLIGCSVLFSIVISIQNLGATYIWELGWLTWLWGLPIWLSGCLLADHLRNGFTYIPSPPWVWRAATWCFSVFCIYLVYHSPIKIGYPLSMLAFSLLAYGWLLKELQSSLPAGSLLERCGAASYSLYLVHNVVLGGLSEHVPQLSPIADLLIRSSSIALGTYIMYRLIEAPSHQLARKLATGVSAESLMLNLAQGLMLNLKLKTIAPPVMKDK